MAGTKRKVILTALVILLICIGASYAWWKFIRIQPLRGIVSGNGRLEATEIDIATKFHGRVAEVLFDEGDTVEAGQVVARIDTESLEAQLEEAKAGVEKAKKELAYAKAVLSQRESEYSLANKHLVRAKRLLDKGTISLEEYDRAKTEVEIAEAQRNAAKAQIANAEASIKSSVAVTKRLRVDINDCNLKSPRNARVQYRLAETGEVLPAGGKILTIIDLNDIYMTIFLPELEAGKVPIGSDARIVLDALPDRHFPARVSFVASKAQFTPKQVETKTERQKLVFRIRVDVLQSNHPLLKPGIPGVAYIPVDDEVEWPEHLK